MISKRLVNEVVKEATKLLEHATSTELNRLAFSRLDAESWQECIYGQATGDCRNGRAKELLGQCAIALDLSEDDFGDVSCKVQRGNKKKFQEREQYRSFIDHFSPIETYIMEDGIRDKQ